MSLPSNGHIFIVVDVQRAIFDDKVVYHIPYRCTDMPLPPRRESILPCESRPNV